MSYKKLALTLTFSVGSVFLINCQADSPSCTTGTIETASGTVCGVEVEASNTGKTADAFLGIPYAESTGGKNRWKSPKPKKHWKKTFRATQFGLFCPQPPLIPAFVRPSGEDCLSINVWTPNGRPVDASLPVMVFFHPGAFLIGGSGISMYDGSYLSATENVVLVSFNYRLGALGFLVSKGLQGNYGFLDQQLALKWVQKNIQNFGGDPNKVTLVGHSAGAISVGLHLASAPSSQNLFRAGIVQSNPYSLPYKTKKEARDIGQLFASLLNCKKKSCLRNKSVEEILMAQNAVVSYFPTIWQGLGTIMTWMPVIDDDVLINQPIEAQFIQKPTIIGTVPHEGMVFTAFANPEGDISATEYEELIQIFFKEKAPQVLGVYPSTSPFPGVTPWMTLSQLITDYMFTCGSHHVAEKSTINGYVDQFTQRSSFNVPLSYIMGMPFCSINSDIICHGFELPYIFHTDHCYSMGFYSNDLCIEFNPEEEQLSEDMMHYWANFARHLNPNNGGVFWPSFQTNKDYLELSTSITQKNAAETFEACRFWDFIGYDLSEHFWPVLIEKMNENIQASQ